MKKWLYIFFGILLILAIMSPSSTVSILFNNLILLFNSESESAYYNRGISYLINSNYTRAISDFESTTMLNPSNSSAYQNLCYLYINKGENNNALECCSKAIMLNPKDKISYYNLACIYSLKNNLELSISNLKMSINSGFSNVSHLTNDPDLNNVKENSQFKKLVFYLNETYSPVRIRN